LGFFGALRRSELVALDVRGRSYVEIAPEGLRVHVTGSKASAATETIVIPRRDDELCAARALERYLASTGLRSGTLFRPISKAGRLLDRRLEATAVRHILRQRAGKTSLSPHSLRSGFITSAAKSGAPEHVIQRTSRHKSVDVLRSYIRSGECFAGAAAGRL
jgi:integrase